MRKIVAGIFLLLIASSARAQAPTGATDITAAQVQAFIKDAPHDRNSDRPIRVVDSGGYRVGIFGVFRPKSAPPNATMHQTNVADVVIIPGGVPHGWASTEGDITYLIVRPDPDKKLSLK